MSRIGAWFRGSAPTPSQTSSPAASLSDLRAKEIASLEDALSATGMIMNDDIDGAEERLRKGDSAFHLLGLGACTFMRSILGFEKSIMAETLNRLNECETRALGEMKRAQKEAEAAGNADDRIYPPGSEYALIIAYAHLMAAVVAVMNESLTEGLKGFYKLRKAFITLDGLVQAETAYLKRKGFYSDSSSDDTDTDLEFVDADEAHSGAQTPLDYGGHLTKNSSTTEEKLSKLSLNSNGTSKPSRTKDGSEAFTNLVDIFTHSGANMTYGVLLTILTLVPPAFSRLLSIIGFKGDRERGLQLLWQSSRFENVNGAIASIVLFAYYHGLLSSADILPFDKDNDKSTTVGYPRDKCIALLAQMRSRYPDSGLWRFEEGRVKANSKDLRGALEILKSNTESKMRQVTAINNFEMSLSSMYIHDYSDMRDNFLRCIELNDWSPTLYYYIAACGELENYRNAFHNKADDSQVQLHKKKAEELFRKGPTLAGKKRFLAKPMPFEQFVCRKMQKWEERAKVLGIDLADAIGPSPSEEMTYLWNGMKKMQPSELEFSNKVLSWDRLTAPEEARKKIEAELDEEAVRNVCRAAVARSLGNLDKARELLDSVLAMDRQAFRGPTKDDYALPAANYEMAVLAWVEVQKPELRRDDDKGDEKEWLREKTEECQAWLEKVANWGAFILDARIGMRVQTGMDTVSWYKKQNGWASA
ncbi:hypothetical protein F5Y11DRAFT_356613 [Daldinia sp. FL1419]|nr:hypothetical protein F5Y11DRAFT_356613 [Daldinia sp. FL1419]